MPNVVDISRFLDEQKIGKFQIGLLILSFLLMMIDGYDIVAAAFAGPSLIHEWGLRGPELGVLFSATLAAGFIGAPLLGYISDHIGRKKVIVYAALYFGVLTWASVLAHNLTTLTVLRFLAGIGVAGILPIVVSLNNEFAPTKFRATMVVLIFTGNVFGGALPGLVAARFVPTLGWHILFTVGGIASIAVAVLMAFTLPESVKYLALQPQRRPELLRTLGRIKPDVSIPADTEFVVGSESNRSSFSMKALFAGRLALLTPLFWIVSAVNLMVFYFMSSWMPTLLSMSGITVTHAALATTVFQLGGTLAGFVTMRFLDRNGFIPVPILFAVAIPIVACIGLRGLHESTIVTLIAIAGFCLYGLQFGNIALEANIFPTYIRAWGVGSCFAAGRTGAAIGPLAGGGLLAMHVGLQETMFIAACPLIVGLVIAIFIVPRYRDQIASMSSAISTGAAVGA